MAGFFGQRRLPSTLALVEGKRRFALILAEIRRFFERPRAGVEQA